MVTVSFKKLSLCFFYSIWAGSTSGEQSMLCFLFLCFSVSLHILFLLCVEAILMPQARLGKAAFALFKHTPVPCIGAGEQRGISLILQLSCFWQLFLLPEARMWRLELDNNLWFHRLSSEFTMACNSFYSFWLCPDLGCRWKSKSYLATVGNTSSGRVIKLTEK